MTFGAWCNRVCCRKTFFLDFIITMEIQFSSAFRGHNFLAAYVHGHGIFSSPVCTNLNCLYICGEKNHADTPIGSGLKYVYQRTHNTRRCRNSIIYTFLVIVSHRAYIYIYSCKRLREKSLRLNWCWVFFLNAKNIVSR